jgi:division protein CdvB (Snf7/Vps24/ESCRT-III family)
MTDAQKIEALTDLLFTVINTLELTKYDIEDVTESHNVVIKADAYQQQMFDILHSES